LELTDIQQWKEFLEMSPGGKLPARELKVKGKMLKVKQDITKQMLR
jgi:hypothetical protein